ncbi:MAG: OBAP family protein [Chitinophagaceae bacterium]|nr:OBAP family protein [Chitinophagaceae bacterium]
MTKVYKLIAISVCIAISSCGGRNSPSNVDAPGDEKTTKDKMLNTGANVLQDKTPLNQFTTYLNGFHFYNGIINAQMEAHHYVQQLNERHLPGNHIRWKHT